MNTKTKKVLVKLQEFLDKEEINLCKMTTDHDSPQEYYPIDDTLEDLYAVYLYLKHKET